MVTSGHLKNPRTVILRIPTLFVGIRMTASTISGWLLVKLMMLFMQLIRNIFYQRNNFLYYLLQTHQLSCSF